MEEKADETEVSYYDQSGVRVTNKRLIIRNTTYAMADITSTSMTVENPNLTGPVLFIVFGLLVIVMGLTENPRSGVMAVIGVIVGGLGYFCLRGCKPVLNLRIVSASGKSTRLKSVNEEWIAGIARAINEARIRRA